MDQKREEGEEAKERRGAGGMRRGAVARLFAEVRRGRAGGRHRVTVRLAQEAVGVASSFPPADERTPDVSIGPCDADRTEHIDEEDLHPVLAERDRLAAEALPDEEQKVAREERRGGRDCERGVGEVVEEGELREDRYEEDEEE